MALEFALRSRLNLERPAPRPRLGWRLPRLAVPIVGYWLAMAGGTYLLLGVLGEDSTEAAAQKPPRPRKTTTAAALPTAAPVEDSASSDAPPSDAPPSDAPPSAPLAQVAGAAAPAPPSETALVDAPPSKIPAITASVPSPPAAIARATASPPPPLPLELPLLGARPETDDPAPRRRESVEVAAPPPAPPRDEAPATSLPSCESAAASANQSIDLRGGRSAPDLTRDAFASILENGAYLAGCSVPASTALEICAAVQDGKVVGVSVTTQPRDAAIGACVRRAVAALRFPQNARLDVTRTRFEAAGR